MSRRAKIGIVVGVVAAHAFVFWLVADMHVLPKREYIPPPEPPNFATAEFTTTDPQTGGKIIIHQYNVSTKLQKDADEK
jgi:hypothetical protein